MNATEPSVMFRMNFPTAPAPIVARIPVQFSVVLVPPTYRCRYRAAENSLPVPIGEG